MTDCIILNALTSDFEEDFAEMGRKAHAESQFRDIVSYDAEKVVGIARDYARDSDKCLVVAMDEGGRTIGVFAGHIGELYFSSDKLARDVLWYVEPEHRATGVGLMLLAVFERWAKDRGVKIVYLSQDSGIDVEKFTRILGKRGYSFVGANYSLGVG